MALVDVGIRFLAIADALVLMTSTLCLRFMLSFVFRGAVWNSFTTIDVRTSHAREGHSFMQSDTHVCFLTSQIYNLFVFTAPMRGAHWIWSTCARHVDGGRHVPHTVGLAVGRMCL